MKFLFILMVLFSLFYFLYNGTLFFTILTIILFIFYKNGMVHGMIEEYKTRYKDGFFLANDYSMRRMRGILTTFILSFIYIVYLIFTGEIKLENKITIQKLKGVYLSETWDRKGISITLKDNLTCIISLSSEKCEWEIKQNEIVTYKYNEYYEEEYNAKLTDNGFKIDNHFLKKIE